jgi:hypothetical protein
MALLSRGGDRDSIFSLLMRGTNSHLCVSLSCVTALLGCVLCGDLFGLRNRGLRRCASGLEKDALIKLCSKTPSYLYHQFMFT